MRTRMCRTLAGLVLACAALPAWAQLVIEDTLTGASSSYNWNALKGACLTAGDGSGSIPACIGLPYYGSAVQVGGLTGRLPDPPGRGALRLTNGDVKTGGSNGDFQIGAVVSNFTLPSTQGLEVTFTTVTYGGDGLRGIGADGMSFFLMDGARPPAVGAPGGSLGYSCKSAVNSNPDANRTYDGVPGGYLGVGIDEFGNFANQDDNTNTGAGYRAGRIALRGAGDIALASLQARRLALYPTTLTDTDKGNAVRRTCQTGLLQNFSGKTVVDRTGRTVAHGASTAESAGLDYPLLAYSDLPDGVVLANQQGVSKPLRDAATPVTYALKITQDGLLSLAYSFNGGTPQQVISSRSIAADNGPVPASLRFGFAASTGSGSNVHEITCFKAAPLEQSQSSAATNVPQSARVEAGTQLYLASYHPGNWWGELTAQSLLLDPLTDIVSINPVANWNASCVLTGGACAATGQSQAAQAPAQRRMLTWDGSRGVPFQWDRLTAAQRSALTAGDAAVNAQRLAYLRGERGQEVASGGAWRTRNGVLGDIMDSGPTWVGAPASPYAGPWVDSLYPQAQAPEAAGPAYAEFQRRHVLRQNVVYVGANDGWLHGFRAGAHDAQGRFVADAGTPNDGLEVLAYMPAAVLASVHTSTPALDYSATLYAHAFHVDATPGSGDLYYAGAWHTWLVGGLGPGGQAGGPVADKTGVAPGTFYALDITDPQRFSEANAASLVVGEWSAAALACVNVATCGQHLGSVYGTPLIRRLHNGQWAVLFGNGLHSTSGRAGLFVMGVDPATGATSLRYLDTGRGPAADPLGGAARNGIVQVTAADLDGDHITDYVYGGDVFGNVWRFDLSSDDAARWGAGAVPVYSTGGAPISSKVVVASVPDAAGGRPRVILGFGTGRRTVQTLTQAAAYAEGEQALYGVWDWDLAAWNAKAAPAARYASLAAPQTVARSKLLVQNVLATVAGSGTVSGYRTVSRRKVCWQGSATCASGNVQFGWVLSLPIAAEQVVYNPVIAYGMLIVNTTVPEQSQPLTCSSAPASGYTMALTMGDGGAAAASFFANADNRFVSYDGEFVSGIGLSATGTPSIVSANRKPYLAGQTVKGDGAVTPINPTPGGVGGRLTWMELR